jgi:putative ABC transport system permease protein
MPPPPNANVGYTAYIRIVPEVVALAFAVGVVAAAIAAIPPGIKVSRTPLDVALRANV